MTANAPTTKKFYNDAAGLGISVYAETKTAAKTRAIELARDFLSIDLHPVFISYQGYVIVCWNEFGGERGAQPAYLILSPNNDQVPQRRPYGGCYGVDNSETDARRHLAQLLYDPRKHAESYAVAARAIEPDDTRGLSEFDSWARWQQAYRYALDTLHADDDNARRYADREHYTDIAPAIAGHY